MHKKQKDIIGEAGRLIAAHGRQAEVIADRKMKEKMENGDVKEAGYWLAVLHEIHRCQSSSDVH